MIIEFSIGNYRSVNDVQTLSFKATGLTSENKTVDANNITEVAGHRLLKTVGVYGPNGSGKSNLLKGLEFFKAMVDLSLENERFFQNRHNPNTRSFLPPSPDHLGYFQIILLLAGKKYRYGFTLNHTGIDTEWLFGPAKNNETFYFIRSGGEIKMNADHFPEGEDLPYKDKLRSNALFLSFCSSYNGTISAEIRDFIVNKTAVNAAINDYHKTNALASDPSTKNVVLMWLKEAGLHFDDIKIKSKTNNTAIRLGYGGFMPETDDDTVELHKTLYSNNGEGTKIIMDLFGTESDGTRKYYAYIGMLYDLFQHGGLFIADEIDSNFHPALLRKIISLFNNPNINKANAQLLFSSHDTNLMDPEIMRRDQFYFTEKSPKDETILYSLSDLKGIRNNADFAKQYLAGYYGALPVLGDFQNNTNLPTEPINPAQ